MATTHRMTASPGRARVSLAAVLLLTAACNDDDGALAGSDGGAGAAPSTGGASQGSAGPSGSGGSSDGGASMGGQGPGGGGPGGGGGSPSATGCRGPSGIQIASVKVSDHSRASHPKVFPVDGSTLAVAWQQEGYGTLLRLADRATLAPLAPEPIQVEGTSEAASQLRFAPWPSGFGLSYRTTHWLNGGSACRAKMFGPDLQQLGMAYASTADAACDSPSMVHDGAGWGYLWYRGNGDVFLRFLEDTGEPLSGAVVDEGGGYHGMVSGFNPLTQRYIVVYEKGFEGEMGSEVVSAEVDLTGSVLASGVRISDAPGASSWPEIAWNGTGFGVIWEDDRDLDAHYDLFFAELDGSGTPLGPEVELITTANGYLTGARIVSNGQVHGVVWRAAGDEVRFQAIDHAGAKIGAEHLVATDVPEDVQVPDITWDGERFVVAWFEDTQGVQSEEVFLSAVCP
jgi:hypothetical protein